MVRCPQCRTRRQTLADLEGHKCSLVRCPGCRTRRATFTALLKHIETCEHKLCNCGHVATTGAAFPHRPGTRFCEKHPYTAVHLAERYGATDEELLDLMVEIALTTPGKPADTHCPF